MATTTISKITLPDGTICNLKDRNSGYITISDLPVYGGEVIDGTPITIYSGSEIPSNSLGEDGDLYIYG